MADHHEDAKDYEPPRLEALGAIEDLTGQLDISVVIGIGLPRTG